MRAEWIERGSEACPVRVVAPGLPLSKSAMDNTVAASPSTPLERPRHSSLSRLAVAFVLALAVSGCATQGGYLSAGQANLGGEKYGETYKVGPITVLIRPQPDVELICKLRGAKAPTTARIHGCYVPADKMIVSIADPYVLLHEFRHHFEGAWHK